MTHSERDEGLLARASGVPDDFEPDDGKPAMEHPDDCAGAHGREALAELLASVDAATRGLRGLQASVNAWREFTETVVLERDREIIERLADK